MRPPKAEIVFIEDPMGDRWEARLVAPRYLVRDIEYVPMARGGTPVNPSWGMTITLLGSGRYELFRRLGGRGSERRDRFDTLQAAQDYAAHLAARRFRVIIVEN